jgi:hypothetical protein
MLTRLFRLRSFISICRAHPLAVALAITRSDSRSSVLRTLKKADVGAKMSAVQTGVWMRTWACDDGYSAVAVS